MGLQINYLYVKSVTSEQYCAEGCMRIIYMYIYILAVHLLVLRISL